MQHAAVVEIDHKASTLLLNPFVNNNVLNESLM